MIPLVAGGSRAVQRLVATAVVLVLLVGCHLRAADASVRYADLNENFVPVVGAHNGPGARRAPKGGNRANQPGALPGYQRQSLDWFDLSVDAPPLLASAAARIRGIDVTDLGEALGRAGLELPSSVHVTLIANDDPRARETPPWVVGRAFGSRDIVIFPSRAAGYPYDSLESILRHEVVHLALDARAGGRPLPRWFHEGVATSMEAGWDVTDQLRLLVAALRDPEISDVSQLFQSEAQSDTILAYLLATVLVEDLRQRYGGACPGRIAAHVARGVPFARALEMETGETPDTAAAHAWRAYLRWTNWVPTFTSGSAVWTVILALACVVFVVRRRRRARRRQAWDDEETDGSWSAH